MMMNAFETAVQPTEAAAFQPETMGCFVTPIDYNFKPQNDFPFLTPIDYNYKPQNDFPFLTPIDYDYKPQNDFPFLTPIDYDYKPQNDFPFLPQIDYDYKPQPDTIALDPINYDVPGAGPTVLPEGFEISPAAPATEINYSFMPDYLSPLDRPAENCGPGTDSLLLKYEDAKKHLEFARDQLNYAIQHGNSMIAPMSLVDSSEKLVALLRDQLHARGVIV